MSNALISVLERGLGLEMYSVPSLGHGKVHLVQFGSCSGEYTAWMESEAFGGSHTVTMVGFQLCAVQSCIIFYNC